MHRLVSALCNNIINTILIYGYIQSIHASHCLHVNVNFHQYIDAYNSRINLDSYSLNLIITTTFRRKERAKRLLGRISSICLTGGQVSCRWLVLPVTRQIYFGAERPLAAAWCDMALGAK